jgi:hypothetical protein
MNPTYFLSHSFDPTRKLYIKKELNISGRVRERGEYYDWKGVGESYQTILTLFFQDFFYHKPVDEEEEKEVFADVFNKNLDGMALAELHAYIDKLNEKFHEKAKTAKEFREKKCPKVPKDVEAQVRRIKFWRDTHRELFE